MREEKFHIYLNDDEYSRVIQTLIRLWGNPECLHNLSEQTIWITTGFQTVHSLGVAPNTPIKKGVKQCGR